MIVFSVDAITGKERNAQIIDTEREPTISHSEIDEMLLRVHDRREKKTAT